MLKISTDFLTIPIFTYNKYIACIVAESVDTYLDVKICPQFFQPKFRGFISNKYVFYTVGMTVLQRNYVCLSQTFLELVQAIWRKQNMEHKMHSSLSLFNPQNHISATALIQLPEAKQLVLSKHVLAIPTTGCS
jgi:hypothetical protein